MIKKTLPITLGLCLAASTSSLAQDKLKAGFLWSDQGNSVSIIAGDNIPDPIRIFPLRVKSENFTFVITDSDRNVLTYTTNNVVDLDGAGTGLCRVYGFAYNGEFDFPTGVNVDELKSSAESALSKNRVDIERLSDGAIDGGWVLNDRRGYGRVIVNLNKDPKPFRVYSYNEASSSTNYAYIITDNTGKVLGFPEENAIDLSSAPVGVCRVYGISFTGELNKTTGVSVEEVTSTENNQDLSSNWVTAVRR